MPNYHDMRGEPLQIRAANFVTQAMVKFDNAFDYSRIVYRGVKEPVEIICPHHGSFHQTPVSHLNSRHGCPTCALVERYPKRKQHHMVSTRARLRHIYRLYDQGDIESATLIYLDMLRDHGDWKKILRTWIRTRKPNTEVEP